MSSGQGGDTVAGLLNDAARAMGLELDATPRARLVRYAALVEKWGARTNLTGARDARDFARDHLVDSLAITPCVSEGPLLDVGSGAGLPGMVLAILRPTLAVTLLEPRQRRARFLTQVSIELTLENVTVCAQRIEVLPREFRFRTIVSRAFASLAVYARLALPHLAPGGELLAMKGTIDPVDRAAAERLAGPATVIPLHVPGFRDRHLVRFRAP